MRKHKTLVVRAKAPDAKGTFEGTILHNPAEGDSDNERIENWINLPATVPLGYSHVYGDPGAKVGEAEVLQLDYRRLKVLGRLGLSNPMATAVHERMLLPPGDPMVLAELSVGFTYDVRKTTTDPSGVRVLHDAALEEVSIVHRGAQGTSISNIKGRDTLADHLVKVARQNGVTDATRLTALRQLVEAHHVRPDNVWLLKAGLADLLDSWRDPATVRYEREIDEAASRQPVVTDADRKGADDLVLQTKLDAIRAKLAEAEQERWQDEMAARSRWLADTTPTIEQEREIEFREREQTQLAHDEAVREHERQEREAADEARRQATRDDPRVLTL